MIDPKTIDDLKAKHGDDLHLMRHAGVEFVFKRPTKDIYRRFKMMATSDARKADASERFVFDCLVFPEASAASAALEKQPGLVDTFAGELIDLAGTAKECEVVPL